MPYPNKTTNYAHETKDPYVILGISKNASREEIRQAYRRLALRYHPDKIKGTEQEKKKAGEKFAEISAAYEILTNPPAQSNTKSQNRHTGSSSSRKQYPFFYTAAAHTEGEPSFFTTSDSNGFRDIFTDPFELFRQTFRNDDFIQNNSSFRQQQHQTNNSFSNNHFFNMQQNPFGFMSFQSSFSSSSFFQDSHFHNPILSPMPMPMNGFSQFSSSSFTSSAPASSTGFSGTSKSVSTSTQIINGQRITKTNTTIIHPDGNREIFEESHHKSIKTNTPSSTPAVPQLTNHVTTKNLLPFANKKVSLADREKDIDSPASKKRKVIDLTSIDSQEFPSKKPVTNEVNDEEETVQL